MSDSNLKFKHSELKLITSTCTSRIKTRCNVEILGNYIDTNEHVLGVKYYTESYLKEMMRRKFIEGIKHGETIHRVEDIPSDEYDQIIIEQFKPEDDLP